MGSNTWKRVTRKLLEQPIACQSKHDATLRGPRETSGPCKVVEEEQEGKLHRQSKAQMPTSDKTGHKAQQPVHSAELVTRSMQHSLPLVLAAG